MSDKTAKRLGWLLWGLPLWLAVSAGAGLCLFAWRAAHPKIEQHTLSQEVSVDSIADDLKKILLIIGERNTASEAAATNLSRMQSMIEGLLGPGNTGFHIEKIKGPKQWPIIHVTVVGSDPKSSLEVIATYDSPVGSKGAMHNAVGLAATLAAAQAVANDKPLWNIDFFFLPHANEAGTPVHEEVTQLRTKIPAIAVAYSLMVEAGDSNERAPSMLYLQMDRSGTPIKRLTALDSLPATAGDENQIPAATAVARAAEQLVKEIRNPGRK